MPAVLMTGGHSGIGLVGARVLAEDYQCDLILAGRSKGRLDRAARQLRTETGKNVGTLYLDLTSLDSVREAAAKVKAMLADAQDGGGRLKGIVCNASHQSKGPVIYSADGYETIFASNCLGQFLLVNLLLDSIESGGRVLWTASGTHDPALMDGKSVGKAVVPNAKFLANQGRDCRAISEGRRYATSKLCLIMYCYELQRRLVQAGIPVASIAYDPGFLPDAGMGLSALDVFRSKLVRLIMRNLGMTMGQMPLSGEALAMLNQDIAYEGKSGKYFHSKNGVLKETRSSEVSYDVALAAQLWRDSDELVRLSDSERASILIPNASDFCEIKASL